MTDGRPSDLQLRGVFVKRGDTPPDEVRGWVKFPATLKTRGGQEAAGLGGSMAAQTAVGSYGSGDNSSAEKGSRQSGSMLGTGPAQGRPFDPGTAEFVEHRSKIADPDQSFGLGRAAAPVAPIAASAPGGKGMFGPSKRPPNPNAQRPPTDRKAIT